MFFKDKYRDTFAKFCTQLDHFFADLDQYRAELTSLLTENCNYSGSGATHLVNHFFLQIAAQHSQNLYL